MLKPKLILTAERKQSLVDYRTSLRKQFEPAVAGHAALRKLTAKRDKLAIEIAGIEATLNPDDSEALVSRRTALDRMSLLKRQIASEQSKPDQLTEDLMATLCLAKDIVRVALGETIEGWKVQLTEHIQPLYFKHNEAFRAASCSDACNAFLSFMRRDYGVFGDWFDGGTECLRVLDTLLDDGNVPWTFEPHLKR